MSFIIPAALALSMAPAGASMLEGAAMSGEILIEYEGAGGMPNGVAAVKGLEVPAETSLQRSIQVRYEPPQELKGPAVNAAAVGIVESRSDKGHQAVAATTERPSPAPEAAKKVAVAAVPPAADAPDRQKLAVAPAETLTGGDPESPAITKQPVAQLPTPKPPIAIAPVAPSWVAHNGSTLQLTIKEWASRAGWVVAWNDEKPDLEVVGTIEVTGNIVDAISYLFDVYQRSGASFDVELYKEQRLVLVKGR